VVAPGEDDEEVDGDMEAESNLLGSYRWTVDSVSMLLDCFGLLVSVRIFDVFCSDFVVYLHNFTASYNSYDFSCPAGPAI
jgi:hypothetical protein